MPLNVSSDIQDSLTTDLGFRGWYDVHFGQIGMRPFVRAAWEHEFLYSALPISASLVNIPGPPATFFSPSLGRDSAVVNAGVSVQWTRSFATYVSYDGQLGGVTMTLTASQADSESVSEPVVTCSQFAPNYFSIGIEKITCIRFFRSSGRWARTWLGRPCFFEPFPQSK